MLLLFVLLGILLPLRTNSIVEPEAQWIDRDRYGSGKTIVRLGQEQERCEIIWVRCNESVTRSVYKHLPAMGYRVNIVEKCDKHHSADTPPFFFNSMYVPNVGDEGYGYLAWIMARWFTLPECMIFMHGSHEHFQHPHEFLTCLKPASAFSSQPLAIPLGGTYVAGRKFQGCAFKHIYQRMETKLGKQVIPYANGHVVNVYCCNSWLVTKPAILQHGHRYWEFFMNISLWHVCGRNFAHVVGDKHKGHPPHPDLGVMYEHIFHMMLGHGYTYPRGQRLEDLSKVLDHSRQHMCSKLWPNQHPEAFPPMNSSTSITSTSWPS